LVGVSGFPLFCLEVFSICEVDRLAQSQALLDLLFVSAADDICELPTPMSVSGADADADGATVKSTVEDL
jgi:hypothetical protein